MPDFIWKLIQKKVDAQITRRLLAFHRALVERGQIPDAPKVSPPEPGGYESAAEDVVSHYCKRRTSTQNLRSCFQRQAVHGNKDSENSSPYQA